MVLSRGAAPLFLGVEHRGQYEPPQRTEKADVGSRTRQVVLTEPLRFRLGHPMDHSNAAGSPSSLRFPEMRTAHARMSIDGICVQVRGNVVRSFSCEKLNLADFDKRRSAFLHFAGAKRRAQKKAASRRFKFCWGNIAARIRSLNFVGKVTGVPVPVLAQTPF